jgi:hypothetical protein
LIQTDGAEGRSGQSHCDCSLSSGMNGLSPPVHIAPEEGGGVGRRPPGFTAIRREDTMYAGAGYGRRTSQSNLRSLFNSPVASSSTIQPTDPIQTLQSLTRIEDSNSSSSQSQHTSTIPCPHAGCDNHTKNMFKNEGHFQKSHLRDDGFLFSATRVEFEAFVGSIQQINTWYCMKCRGFWARGRSDKNVCKCGGTYSDVDPLTNIRVHESVDYPGRRPGPRRIESLPANDPAPLEESSDYLPFTENPSIFLDIRKVATKTVDTIGKRPARVLTRLFSAALKGVNSNPLSMDKHASLEQLPSLLFASVDWNDKIDRTDNRKAQSKGIFERVKKFTSGGEGKRVLWEDATETAERLKRGSVARRPPSDEMRTAKNHARCKKFLDQGFISKASSTLLSGGIAENNQETFNTIKGKFPVVELPSVVPNPPTALQVSQKDVKSALMSFPHGSAGNRDGLKPKHLQDMYRYSTEADKEELLQELTKYVNCALSGQFPSELAEFFASSNVIPLIKLNGDLRPIAIGSTWRRLVCKAAFRSILPEAIAFLSPNQCGVGVKGGCEAIVHAFTTLVDKCIDDPGYAAGLADAKNAFNLVDRQKFLDSVHENFPSLYRFVTFLYAGRSLMFMGESWFYCYGGVHQGCPLGPFLFCLAIHGLLMKIKNECPDLDLIAYFLDDGTFFGKIADVAKALEILTIFGPEYGIFLNTDKTEIFCPAASTLDQIDRADLFSRIRGYGEWNTRGVKLLGGLIGSLPFIQEEAEKKLVKVKTLLDAILELKDSSRQFTLIKNCGTASKIGYLLRVCDSNKYPEQVVKFDNMLDDALTITLGTKISTPQRDLLGLPASFGGLDFSSASCNAKAYYIASRVQFGPLQASLMGLDDPRFNMPEIQERLADLTTSLDLPVALTTLDVLGTHPQRDLCAILYRHKSIQLKNSLNPRAIKLLEARLSSSYVHWPSLIPSESMKQYLPNDEFRCAIKYQLGFKITEEGGKCEVCSGIMDAYGAHATVCKLGGATIARHNTVRDKLVVLAGLCGYVSEYEKKDLLKDGSARRPADVWIQSWIRDKDLAIDVAVVDGAVNDNIKKTEKTKNERYLVDCANNGLGFIPFVMDSFGRMGEAAEEVLNKLAHGYAENFLQPVGKSKERLRKVIVQTMIRAQSAQIIRRIK